MQKEAKHHQVAILQKLLHHQTLQEVHLNLFLNSFLPFFYLSFLKIFVCFVIALNLSLFRSRISFANSKYALEPFELKS